MRFLRPLILALAFVFSASVAYGQVGQGPINNPTTIPYSTSAQSNWFDIAAWGDSLTAGGQSGAGNYPADLSVLQNTYVYNGGVSGQTSTQIAARQEAATTLLGMYNVIWAGRNNFAFPTTVQTDIAGMVSALPVPKRFAVLTILNGEGEGTGTTNYTEITALNADLIADYPSNYLDIRELLVGQYNPANPADVIDHTNDVPPYSLRSVDLGGTLNGAVASTSTCAIPLTVTTGTLAVNYIITVDTEEIYVTTISGSSIATCTRGYASTTAATHSNGAAFTGVDPLHLNAAGYSYVASKVSAYINSNDPGVGNLIEPLSSLRVLFASPPPIGITNPNMAIFAGPYNVTTPEQTASTPALALTQALGNSDYTMEDFLWPSGGSLTPEARIAVNFGGSGSCIGLYTSNNYSLGPNFYSGAACYNGFYAGSEFFLCTAGLTPCSGVTRAGDGSWNFTSNLIPSATNTDALGNNSNRWLELFVGTAGIDNSASEKAQLFISNGITFTFGTNGCSATSATGGGGAGTFVSGTTGTCTVTINIGSAGGLHVPPSHGYSCWSNDETTTADRLTVTGSTTTSVTLSGTTVSGDVIDFGCMGF